MIKYPLFIAIRMIHYNMQCDYIRKSLSFCLLPAVSVIDWLPIKSGRSAPRGQPWSSLMTNINVRKTNVQWNTKLLYHAVHKSIRKGRRGLWISLIMRSGRKQSHSSNRDTFAWHQRPTIHKHIWPWTLKKMFQIYMFSIDIF